MKFIFKLCFSLFISTAIVKAHARDMVVITYHTKVERAQLIKSILENEINLPANLIRLYRQRSPCQRRSLPIVQICIDENEQMHFVVFNDEVVLNSFNVFWE